MHHIVNSYVKTGNKTGVRAESNSQNTDIRKQKQQQTNPIKAQASKLEVWLVTYDLLVG